MGVSIPAEDRSPSLAALALVDEICVRFEEQWRAGCQPLLEDFLADAPAPVRADLLPALLAVELGHRCRRFPDAAAVLPRLIAEAAGNEGQGGQTTPPSNGPTAASPTKADGLAVLGDYDILEELGRGGMGVVYKARQRSANRIVALKVIRADRLEGGSAEECQRWLDRFHREARAAARLVHDHILPVYEVGQADGRHFYSMRYVEGRSLAEVLREGPLPERAAAVCLERVARAIDYAHAQGILHRDLKPGNILLDADQRPYVTDYGLAKWMEGPQDMTQTGQWLGSPPYLSPEQAQDAARVTAASDIYGLGATLYHALTGRPPFQAAEVLETLRQVKTDDPVPPYQLNPAVSRDLETICLKCLAKEPSRRYTSALALAEDLRRFLAGEPIQARRTPLWERAGKWARRRPTAAVLVGVTSLALAAILILSTWYTARLQGERNRAEGALESLRTVEEILARAQTGVTKLGQSYDQKDLSKEAEAEYRLAVELSEGLTRAYPGKPEYQSLLAQSYYNLGDRYGATKQVDKAEDFFRKALAVWEPLVRAHPGVSAYTVGLGKTYGSVGHLLFFQKNQPQEALSWYGQAIPLVQEVLAKHPQDALARQASSHAYSGRAFALNRFKRYRESIPAWERAIELEDEPTRRARWRVHWAWTLLQVHGYGRAVQQAEAAFPVASLPTSELVDLASIFSVAAAAARRTGSERPAQEYVGRAFQLLERAADKGYFNDPAQLRELKTDPDFDAVRAHADFPQLLKRISERAKGYDDSPISIPGLSPAK
jgi:serine/threonine protein kinase